MSLGKVLLASNSLDECQTAVSSIPNMEDELNQDCFLDEVAEMNNLLDSDAFNTVEVTNESKFTTLNYTSTNEFTAITANDGENTVWTCVICSKEFSHQYKLINHLYTHNRKTYECDICGKEFRQPSILTQHKTTHSEARPHTCSVCNKSYKRASTLANHRKTHAEHKSYRCPYCMKAFHQKGNLRNHIFTHTNERPYKCDICGKGFNQMSNLAQHKQVHQQDSVQRYDCNICGKSFEELASCRDHELNDHADTIAVKIKRPPVQSKLITDGDSNNIPDLPQPDTTCQLTIDPIDTERMRLARETNAPKVVLLRPSKREPVLARVQEAGTKQMLVPIAWTELSRYTQIITTKQKRKVQIKVPIVATMKEVDPTIIVTDGDSDTRTLNESSPTDIQPENSVNSECNLD